MKLCCACRRPLTGQQARQSLARMIEAGLTVQEALLPLRATGAGVCHGERQR